MLMMDWLILQMILTEKKFLKIKFWKSSWHCWKILDFNKQLKGKGIKILTPERMLQRIPIALSQVNADDTSENLINKIRQITFSLYREKKVTKKV